MQYGEELIKNEVSSRNARYLLVIGILVISFSLACILRAQPAIYGFELAEFDPYFNYRATEFIVENGLLAYFEWNDDLSWHPYGRDVSSTSQVMLHATAATLYQIFGVGSTLYDFTLWFPLVISSLTAIIIFGIVRVIGGTTAGLFASMLFAISPIIIMRGTMGWFKSEPLGLFYGLLAIYLLLSAIKSDKGKISLAKIVGAGVFLAFGLSAWGGAQFFIFPIGFFFMALPFLRKDNKYIVLTSVVFTTVFFLVTTSFGRYDIAFVSNLNGFFLILCTAFLVVATLVKKISGTKYIRNIGILLGGTIMGGIAFAIPPTTVQHGMTTILGLQLPSFRYLNAANPFFTTDDILVDSVSEHATSSLELTFFFFSILIVFAGIGAWFLLDKRVNHYFRIKNELVVFALIIGILGVYFSSAFVRLEVFGSIAVIILGSIGISILLSKIQNQKHKPTNATVKISFFAAIVVILAVPLFYPLDHNWSNYQVGMPIPILNGGTHYDIATNDWSASMEWLKENTAEDVVVAAWWDYGYWISTLSERTTIIDNSTLLDWQIKKIALTYLSTPDDAWKILTADTTVDVSSYFVTSSIVDSSANDPHERKLEQFTEWQYDDYNENGIFNKDEGDGWLAGYDEGPCGNTGPCAKYRENPGKINHYPTLYDYWQSEVYLLPQIFTGLDADYIVLNLAVKKLAPENIMELYLLNQEGGDETKAFWFMKIAGVSFSDYYSSGKYPAYTAEFCNETLMGHLIPFSPVVFVDPSNPEVTSNKHEPGYMPVYVKHVKYESDDGPFELVYVPPSYWRDDAGPMVGPIIYKINKEWEPYPFS